MYIIFVEHIRYVYTVVTIFYRLVQEITWREWERIKGNDVEAPELTDKQ